jgi:hypothetical protein
MHTGKEAFLEKASLVQVCFNSLIGLIADGGRLIAFPTTGLALQVSASGEREHSGIRVGAQGQYGFLTVTATGLLKRLEVVFIRC